MTKQSTDPPGPDAAIELHSPIVEAAARVLFNLGEEPGIDHWRVSPPTDETRLRWLVKAAAVLRAAAPALRAGVLRDAARDLGASERRSWSRAETFRWLVERADREVAT